MEIRRRRNTGYPPERWEMLNLHYETLVLVDAYIEEKEIKLKTDTIKILMAGFSLKAQ